MPSLKCAGGVFLAIWGLLVGLAPPAAATERGPFVYSRSGWLEGIRAGDAEQFLGVPYAAAPLGELRWRPPEPAPAWRGLREARALGAECAQLPSTNGPGSSEEDCLFLNVYRPTRGFLARWLRPLPVIVWIHGGGAVNGSGNQTDASELAATTDTVVVSINYRLGVFGYLALAGLTAESADASSGNLALLDQQAALRWVRDNIRWLGGDPRNVTIAGQSAGGASVCAHLASPTARGLFDRAIIHSGAFDLLGSGGGGPPCALSTLAEAEAAGAQFAIEAGCADPDTQVACLRAKHPEELLAASTGFAAGNNTSGDALPEPIVEAIEAGRWNRVPVLVGSTHDELQPLVNLIPGLGFPLPELFYEIAVGFAFGTRAPDVLAEYPASDYPDPAFAFGAIFTDAGFACPTHALREVLSTRTRTYGFEFNDPNAPPELQDGMPTGAFHTSDVPYLFRFSPPLGDLNPEQRALSAQMMRWWAAFARRGRPWVRGEPFWPRFRPERPRVMSLETAGSQLIEDFAADHRCAFWSASP